MKIFAPTLIAILVAAVFFGGCSTSIGDFTMISTKNVDIGGEYKKLDQRFKGSDSRPVICNCPFSKCEIS